MVEYLVYLLDRVNVSRSITSRTASRASSNPMPRGRRHLSAYQFENGGIVDCEVPPADRQAAGCECSIDVLAAPLGSRDDPDGQAGLPFEEAPGSRHDLVRFAGTVAEDRRCSETGTQPVLGMGRIERWRA
jgi:hypothetical protein